jgi:hypothetical protein
LIEELFKIQDIYYDVYTESLKNNKKLKDLLLIYNTKYRLQNRKNHHLLESQETHNIKNIMSNTINREEKSRLTDVIYSIKNEINMLKKMLKVELGHEELQEFKEKHNLIQGKQQLEIRT